MLHFTVVRNLDRREFFYARFHSDYNLGNNWVPVSFTLPMAIVPRPSLPTGIVQTIEQYNMIFLSDSKEISHPYPELDNVEGIMEFHRMLNLQKM